MRAWIVPRYGPPRRLRLGELPGPQPGPGRVVVRVRAIGLNFADCMARQGVYPNTPRPPFVPGMEVAGEVASVGDGVEDLVPGQPVVAVPIFGGHAEFVEVPATHVVPLPGGLSWAEGAAIAVTGLTADWALRVVGRARPGDRALVTAAAGGVGTMLVQMARTAGVRVLAVASTERKRRLARELGAEEAAGYGEWEAIAHRWGGLDLVVDAVGGRLFRKAWRRLDGDGRYVLYGFAAAVGARGVRPLRALAELLAMGVVVPFAMVSACRTLAGFNLSLVPHLAGTLRERFTRVAAAVARGEVRPVVGARYRFEELPAAHAALQGRASVGKLVVLVD